MRGRFEEVSPPRKLGHKSNSLPPAQVPQRDIIDAQMAFFGCNNLLIDSELSLAA